MSEIPFINPLAVFTEEGQSYRVLHALPEPTRFEFTHAQMVDINPGDFIPLIPDPDKHPYSQDFNDPGFDFDKFLRELAKWANDLLQFTFVADFNINLSASDLGVLAEPGDADFVGPILPEEDPSNPGNGNLFSSPDDVTNPVSVGFYDEVFKKIIGLNFYDLKQKIKNGFIPYLIQNKSGSLKIIYKKSMAPPKPALYLYANLRMTNFLGDYGVGKILQTLSLMPGEKTELNIRTFKNETTKEAESRSIFDSYSTTVEDEFAKELEDEQSQDTQFDVGVSASFNFSAFGGTIGGSIEGSMNYAIQKSARTFAKVATKHSSKKSSKREINVNVTSEFTSSEGEENSIKRVIENPNADKVVTYVFFVMNQEYHSILHLVDLKVGYYDGHESTQKIVDLDDLDHLLEYCINTPENRLDAKNKIKNSILGMQDHQKVEHPDLYVEEGDRIRFNYDKKSMYPGINAEIEGLIISNTKVVLQTDGIVVDSLVAPASALSEHTQKLHEERLEEVKTRNALLDVEHKIKTKINDSIDSTTITNDELVRLMEAIKQE